MIFHWLPGRYLIFISLLPRTIFHWLPGQHLIYFIAAQDNISLVAWGDFINISLRYFIIIGPFSWMHLALDFGRKFIYLNSRILIFNYPAISAAIGGRNWMDGSMAIWMTLPFWEALQIHHILMDLVDC